MIRATAVSVLLTAAFAAPAAAAASCPDVTRGPDMAPGTEAQHLQLDYWLERIGATLDLDAVVASPGAVSAHSAAIAREDWGHHRIDPADWDPAFVQARLDERLVWLREQVNGGTYVDRAGRPLGPELTARLASWSVPTHPPELRLAEEAIPVRCAPWTDGLYKAPVDPTFDRNNCSTVRPGEALQVVGAWPGDLLLVRGRYSWGWIEARRPLSAPVATPPAAQAAAPITRRAVLEAAFGLVGKPYGWGGQDGGRDCSRFIMDVFDRFGLELPRSSFDQARTGSFMVDLAGVDNETERLLLIDEAARRGLVLLYFPGHIMMYLGRDEHGTPMAIHAFAEYLAPCPGGGETRFTQDRVTVTNLELGRGSSRTAFVQRLTRVVVLGDGPGIALQGAATVRPAAAVQIPEGDACDNSQRHTMIRFSPRTPNAAQPLRVIVTSYEPLAPTELALVAPDGERLTPDLRRLGGPPFTYVATIDSPAKGEWRAAFGDHHQVKACTEFRVRSSATFRRQCGDPETDPRPVWRPRRAWGPRTEAFFAAFIESLFDFPIAEDLTWESLQPLLEDPERNLLYNHFGRHEDKRLHLRPDCADLPYFLRAYFAWKLELPFAFRKCGRGRPGHPPGCSAAMSQGLACQGRDDIAGFDKFVRRKVGGAVHSGHGRTAPTYDVSDYYPVPLTREALRPGTIFADPYGHVMIVAKWVDQTATEQGVLIAADAQPDGTIGRRRFWRGSFLFTPETHTVGAGFKAFRPARYKRPDDAFTVANHYLAETDSFPRYSEQQYEGTADDFYDAMAALTNPRPLDPFAMQTTLVDAFHEQLTRRVVSVDNGEQYKADGGGQIPMPDRLRIFQTSGPWENFSTPSRDMRLLIALDTVAGFPDRVRRNLDRFGLDADDVARLEARLGEELKERDVTYTRSDGSKQRLTLGDVVARAEHLEMAYNPNDCVEIRWAAPPGSAEHSTCSSHAPDAQRRKMDDYRHWFETRQRPAR